MAGTIVADNIQAASTSTLVLKNGVANTPPTIQDSAGTQIGTFCRAWVNFNGTTNTGGFCTIRGSFNVTSVADNATGDYTVNFTTAMPDANYSVVCTCDITPSATSTRSGQTLGKKISGTITASAIQLLSKNGANSGSVAADIDTDYAFVAIFR
jgi:hypothetical protein